MNRSKILQMLIALAAITLIASGLLRALRYNSMSLTEYERQNASREASSSGTDDSDLAGQSSTADSSRIDGKTDPSDPDHGLPDSNKATPSGATGASDPSEKTEAADQSEEVGENTSTLTGALLNGNSQKDNRMTLAEGFYYEPLSDELRRYITGISYPADASQPATPKPAADASLPAAPVPAVEELRYVHILHYDFQGRATEGELICNEFIAADLTEIFYELFCNEYRLEKVLLIEEYDGDDNASMADNNTSCFHYRQIEGETSLSKHAYGLAVDVNPLYNPYITYQPDGTEQILPEEAAPYADRSLSFPYKIDEDDLCYKLFIRHGFTWGGNWNHSRDYQHFQKQKPDR